MKKWKSYSILFLIMWSTTMTISAQTTELQQLTSQLKQLIEPVQTGSSSYKGGIEEIQPGVLRYVYDETDKKGAVIQYAYEFNLADIDPHAVREVTQKDAIYTVLAVRNKQKLVKVYKNNEVQSYNAEVSVIVKDIESARSLSETIKKAIPHAEKVASARLNLKDYESTIAWICENVKDVSLGTKVYKQTVTQGNHPGVLIYKEITSDSKSSNEQVYTFNLADLNAHSLSFKISGSSFTLVMETMQKNKYIAVLNNNESKPYVNSISINTNNVDEARDLKTALTKVIPLAVEKVKADLPVISSEKEGLQKAKDLIIDVNVGAKQISQTLEPNCVCTFIQKETDSKSTTVEEYKYNWMDFNPNATSIDVSGDKIFLTLKTMDSKKMVMRNSNEKFNGYDQTVKIQMADIEKARRAKVVMDKVIEKCGEAYKTPFNPDLKSAINWVLENIKETTLDGVTIVQTFEPVESGKNDKFKFTKREINSKGSGAEELFEFNLANFDPNSLQVEIKGKWLYVSMETEYKNKIINYYKDGKIQPYTSKLDFAVNDTEIARNLIEALKKSINGVKPKS